MSRFREGDVISTTAWSGEYRIDEVDGYVVRATGVGRALGAISVALCNCTLLRRPLRVGDVLVHPKHGRTKVHEGETHSNTQWVECGYAHEDGTPIDVPGEAAKVDLCGFTRQSMGNCPKSRGHEGRCWVDLGGNNAGLQEAEKAERAAADMRATVVTDAQARANRLSDECGALRTERDELLVENATLRRKLEKLERKR